MGEKCHVIRLRLYTTVFGGWLFVLLVSYLFSICRKEEKL
jgi:hypothetical protein